MSMPNIYCVLPEINTECHMTIILKYAQVDKTICISLKLTTSRNINYWSILYTVLSNEITNININRTYNLLITFDAKPYNLFISYYSHYIRYCKCT